MDEDKLRASGVVIIRLRLTMRIITTLRMSRLLKIGTLRSLIIRAQLLIRLRHRMNQLLGRVNGMSGLP